MIRLVLLLVAVLSVAACARNPEIATPADIERFAFRDPGEPALTLYTIVSNETGSGAHTALMVTGSQQVIFDPAGSFHHAEVLRSGDVLYGITPAFVKGYESMHARATHHVVAQRVPVSAAVAERALALVTANGAVASAHCAISTSAILRQLPGFEGVQQTYYPTRLKESFASVTGVQGRVYYEDYTPPNG